MTYINNCRRIALQESRALRAWAQQGRTPPTYQPPDYWDDWVQKSKANATSRKAA